MPFPRRQRAEEAGAAEETQHPLLFAECVRHENALQHGAADGPQHDVTLLISSSTADQVDVDTVIIHIQEPLTA
ncbi:hypothetical protein DQ04_20531000 [Trypanosoma grayi]|uniref:hypothetical protein n=1 Tax=Trypanosoma grayi TaxID=71804 RepID=UPI0004F3F985|nr:hypothetical protein DQ04_20531000 [Trypanosoma grayi]KEG05556.1 hypothetical protein DQ04_20531000 [Trypanosoma grayi]